MKAVFLALGLAGCLGLAAGVSHAQEVTGVTSLRSQGPTWLEKAIDVEIKNAPITDAVMKVLAAARVNIEKVVPETEIPREIRVSLSVKNVRTRDILAAVARLGGTTAFVSESNGKTTVFLRPRTAAPFVVTSNAQGFRTGANPADLENRIRVAVRNAETAIRASRGTNLVVSGLRLPDRRVKIDVRNSDIRESLKDILKQAEMDFALEDDIPEEVKRSFTFENLPIATALNVITQSAEIGWRAERSGERIVVRVGKKYAARSTSLIFSSPDFPHSGDALVDMLPEGTRWSQEFGITSASVPALPAKLGNEVEPVLLAP